MLVGISRTLLRHRENAKCSRETEEELDSVEMQKEIQIDLNKIKKQIIAESQTGKLQAQAEFRVTVLRTLAQCTIELEIS